MTVKEIIQRAPEANLIQHTCEACESQFFGGAHYLGSMKVCLVCYNDLLAQTTNGAKPSEKASSIPQIIISTGKQGIDKDFSIYIRNKKGSCYKTTQANAAKLALANKRTNITLKITNDNFPHAINTLSQLYFELNLQKDQLREKLSKRREKLLLELEKINKRLEEEKEL